MLKIIGWIFVVASFFLAYMSYRLHKVQDNDLVMTTGTITSTPTFSEDDYHHKTGMRFHINNESTPIVIPGHLLKKANQAILTLKIGDEVTLYERQEYTKVGLEKQTRSAYGLWKDDVTFYTKEDALEIAHSGKYIWIALGFIIMGLVIAFFLIRSTVN